MAPATPEGPASPSVGRTLPRRAQVQTIDPQARGAVEIPDSITVKELAELIGVNAADIIRELIKSGIFANINQVIDRDTASLVTSELGYEVAEARVADGSENERARRPAAEAARDVLVRGGSDDPGRCRARRS